MASSYGPTEWTRPGSRRGGRETRSGSSGSATCWNATWPATSSAARTCDPRRRPSWPGRRRASAHRPGRPAPRRLLASRRPPSPDPPTPLSDPGPPYDLHNLHDLHNLQTRLRLGVVGLCRLCRLCRLKWSGRPDLNRRPRGPKPRALASLRYAPVSEDGSMAPGTGSNDTCPAPGAAAEYEG